MAWIAESEFVNMTMLYRNGQNLLVHQLWEFICDSVGRDVQWPRHVERNNAFPLFGVDPIECRLTLLRNT